RATTAAGPAPPIVVQLAFRWSGSRIRRGLTGAIRLLTSRRSWPARSSACDRCVTTDLRYWSGTTTEHAPRGRRRISHEAIYQALYIEGRGALKRELVACLRTGRALRKPRERARNRPQGHVTPDVVLSERPAEADDRAVPGHWEGDLIIG